MGDTFFFNIPDTFHLVSNIDSLYENKIRFDYKRYRRDDICEPGIQVVGLTCHSMGYR